MDRTVLITGGNKGIGLETCRIFLEKEDNVIIVARDFSDFPYKNHERVKLVSFDLKKYKEIPYLLKKIGKIDILINNAGINNRLTIENYSEEKCQDIIDINLKAPIMLIKELLLEQFIPRGEGRIVNVASQASEIGHSDIWYGITKAGIVNLTQSIASEYGNQGIVINSVSPGPVNTEFLLGSENSQRSKKMVQRTYLKRIANPDEVAKVIYWLSVESPVYLNGENIDVNNGIQRMSK